MSAIACDQLTHIFFFVAKIKSKKNTIYIKMFNSPVLYILFDSVIGNNTTEYNGPYLYKKFIEKFNKHASREELIAVLSKSIEYDCYNLSNFIIRTTSVEYSDIDFEIIKSKYEYSWEDLPYWMYESMAKDTRIPAKIRKKYDI